MKKLLLGIFAIVLVVVCGIWFLNSDLEHIEDANGAEDTSIAAITDQEIIDMSTGALGGPNRATGGFEVGGIRISSGVKFSAKKYTGVSEILYDNYILPSDFDLIITTFVVDEGNCELVVVHEDEIVQRLEPGDSVHIRLEDITGYVSLRLVGESAAFTFVMDELEYDMHSHAD